MAEQTVAERAGRAARPPGDAEVEARLAELDELLARVEAIPGPAGELALEAVAALVEMYGAALTRVMAHAAAAPAVVAALTGDALLGHLLVLHGIHPDPVDRRVTAALDDLRPQLAAHGGDAQLLSLEQGVAEVRVSAGGGCGSSAAAFGDVVRETVLAVAPELAEVRTAPPEPAPAFIPLTAVGHRP